MILRLDKLKTDLFYKMFVTFKNKPTQAQVPASIL